MSREPNNCTDDAADLIEMGDAVVITRSGESGTVDGFKAIGADEPQFWVLYVDAGGSARSAWFRASELDPVIVTNTAVAANVIQFPRP